MSTWTQEHINNLNRKGFKTSSTPSKAIIQDAAGNDVSKAVKARQGKKISHNESQLQQGCVKWFSLAYPQFSKLLFAVPNGGRRDGREAKTLQSEGVVSGVADLVFARATKHYHGLFIEMKVGKNKQSDEQIIFQAAVQAQQYRYEVIYDFDSFKALIEQHIAESMA
jgi:hypothetical protein